VPNLVAVKPCGRMWGRSPISGSAAVPSFGIGVLLDHLETTLSLPNFFCLCQTTRA